MDGVSMDVGAVGYLRRIKSAIAVAQAVMKVMRNCCALRCSLAARHVRPCLALVSTLVTPSYRETAPPISRRCQCPHPCPHPCPRQCPRRVRAVSPYASGYVSVSVSVSTAHARVRVVEAGWGSRRRHCRRPSLLRCTTRGGMPAASLTITSTLQT
jgi:hypothetical protein